MKLVSFIHSSSIDNTPIPGFLSPSGNYIIPFESLELNFKSVNDLIKFADENEINALSEKVNVTDEKCKLLGAVLTNDVKHIAPIPYPDQEIICIGINYMEHAVESAKYKQEDFNGERPHPVIFCKRCSMAIGDGDKIDGHFDIQNTLDYESELGVILGKDARNVSKEDALDYVFGYTVINDVTSREMQKKYKQFYFAKSLDTFTIMGPCIVYKDEIPNPQNLHITCHVNGELRQDGLTSDMIFDVASLIEEMSHGMTLKAGTIIATGTPKGAGMGFDPPKFLKSGDIVRCHIDGIGTITNEVR